MRHLPFTAPSLLLLLTASVATAQSAYDRIEQAYRPYYDPADPLGFPLKVKSLAADEYTFWRGSKDLFFQWSREHCADWLADKEAYVATHGDLHLGNVGTYASDAGWGKLGFGMVDFDDSTRLPFQMELLQGAITLELVARQNEIALSDADRTVLHTTLLDTYRTAINSRRNATDLLADDPAVTKMLAKGAKNTYAEGLQKFTVDDGGRFKSLVRKKDVITDILDPVDAATRDDLASALSEAVKNDDRLRKLLKNDAHDANGLRKRLKDVVRRTRIGSSGSQGLHKYLILLDRPLKGHDHDLILYLKQQIPTAAERSGIVPRDPRTPGQRCSEDMGHMTDPRPLLNSWCTWAGRSYWVHFKEPWSDEIEFDDVKDSAELTRMAKVWATVVGAAHRQGGQQEMILPKLTPQLLDAIVARAAGYLAEQRSDFEAFASDARTLQAVRTVDALLTNRPN